MNKTTILTLATAAALLAGCVRAPSSAPMPQPALYPVGGTAAMPSPTMGSPYPGAAYPGTVNPAMGNPGMAPTPFPTAAPVPAATTGIAGLQERQPDLCHAKDYTSALGQPGTVIGTLGVTRDYRVVEYRGIEPQEYNPQRVVFRLDAAGIVNNIDCG